MVIKSLIFKKIIFILAFILAVIPGLSAQVAAQGDSPRLKQRFTWSGGQNALRYEVVFERIEDNTIAVREFTNNHFIEVTLPPGKYRFRVIPYDILDRPAQASDWRNFEILRVPGIEPVYDLVGPEYVTELEQKPELKPEPVSEKITEKKPLPQAEIAAVKEEIPEEWLEFIEEEEEEEEQEIVVAINSYEVVDEPMTWKKAKRHAKIAGGYLAVITSPEEQEYVENLIIDGEHDFYWLGGQRHPKRIKWRWTNGEKFYYNNWGQGQPVIDINQLRREKADDNIDIDRLTMFRYSDTSDFSADLETGHWVNNHKNQNYGYIIEYPNPDLLPAWKRFDGLKKYIIGFGTPVSAALPVYGTELNSDTINFGFGVRLSALFLAGSKFYLGPDISFLINTGDEDSFSVGANLMAMIWLRNEKTAFSFRAGSNYYINAKYFSAHAGLSFHWRFLNKISIELGVDFSHSFKEPAIGYIRPLFGIGFLF